MTQIVIHNATSFSKLIVYYRIFKHTASIVENIFIFCIKIPKIFLHQKKTSGCFYTILCVPQVICISPESLSFIRCSIIKSLKRSNDNFLSCVSNFYVSHFYVSHFCENCFAQEVIILKSDILFFNSYFT